MGESNKDYIRKHVDTIILNTLSASDSYGYDIMKEIEAKSQGIYSIKQPTLYNSLKRLEKIGYITSYEGDISNGGKRRYYSLTELGKDVLDKETAEWEFSRTLMSRLLSDKEYDLSEPPPYDPNQLRPMTKRNVTVSDNPASTNYSSYIPQSVSKSISNSVDTVINNQSKEVKDEQSLKPVGEVKDDKDLSSYNYSSPTKSYNYDNLAVNKNVDDYKNTRGYQLLYGKDDNINPSSSIQVKQDTDAEVKPVQLSIDAIDSVKQMSDDNKYDASSSSKLTYNYDNIKPSDEKTVKQAREKLGLDSINNYINLKPATDRPDNPQVEPNRYIEDNRPIEGLQLRDTPIKKDRREVEPLRPRALRENEVMTNKVQYRPALDELFNSTRRKDDDSYSTSTNKSYDLPVSAGHSFNNLKTKLKNEGYKLRPYSKSNSTSYYLSSFIYNNQINRDCTTLMYLFIVLEILAIYLFADTVINLGLNAYMTIASGLILIPISFWIAYAVNPNKRIKAKFSFKVSILTSLMVFLNLLVVITLVGFFVIKADINDINSIMMPIIVPSILILNIPLSSIVYALLYNSKKYHLR